jgi:hypothetical protein
MGALTNVGPSFFFQKITQANSSKEQLKKQSKQNTGVMKV